MKYKASKVLRQRGRWKHKEKRREVKMIPLESKEDRSLRINITTNAIGRATSSIIRDNEISIPHN